MGTSLSGLTPATTFDGLLKTSDNEPLDGTLKAISTGDGTDTILDLSTTAFKVSGETIVEGATTGQFFKVRNASNPTQEFYIEKQFDSLNIFRLGTNNTGIQIWDSERLGLFVSDFSAPKVVLKNNGSFGVGETSPTSRLQIKGSGTTSATTSLLVQNSAGTDLLKVSDNGAVAISNDGIVINGQSISRTGSTKIQLGAAQLDYQVQIAHTFKTYNGTSYSEVMRITGNTDQFVGIGETTPTARLHIKGSGNDNTTNAFLVQNSDGTELFKLADNGDTVIKSNGGFSFQTIAGTKRIEVKANGEVLLKGGQLAAYSNYNSSNSNLIVGSFASPTARLQVNGSGTTSATTALLVQNSAGTRLMEVQDGGNIFFGAGTSNYLQNGYNLFGNYNAIGSWNIGTASAMGARVGIKGSGTTSATTALLVQNSAGTDLLKVNDNGRVFINKTANDNNANNYANILHGVTDTNTRIFTVSRDSVLRGMDINSGGSTKISDQSGDQSFTHTATAVLEVSSTTQGFLPPRMTTTERDAIASPAAGLMIYNTDTNTAECWNGSAWMPMC